MNVDPIQYLFICFPIGIIANQMNLIPFLYKGFTKFFDSHIPGIIAMKYEAYFHKGYQFSLAICAFPYACNSYNLKIIVLGR